MKINTLNILLFYVLIICESNAYSQCKSKIVTYQFGDSVNHYVKNYLVNKNETKYYCYLKNISDERKRLYISEFHANDLYKEFIKVSNRFIVIDKLRIPLVLDTDDKFACTLNKIKQSDFGPNIINKQIKVGGGFYIEFILSSNSEIKIINIGFDQ